MNSLWSYWTIIFYFFICYLFFSSLSVFWLFLCEGAKESPKTMNLYKKVMEIDEVEERFDAFCCELKSEPFSFSLFRPFFLRPSFPICPSGTYRVATVYERRWSLAKSWPLCPSKRDFVISQNRELDIHLIFMSVCNSILGSLHQFSVSRCQIVTIFNYIGAAVKRRLFLINLQKWFFCSYLEWYLYHSLYDTIDTPRLNSSRYFASMQ